MSLLSPDVFATALLGTMRIVLNGRNAYQESRLLKADYKNPLAQNYLQSIRAQCSAPNVDLDTAIIADMTLRRFAASVAVKEGYLKEKAEFEGVFEVDTRLQVPEPKMVNGVVAVLDEERFQELVRRMLSRQEAFRDNFLATQAALAEAQQASWLAAWKGTRDGGPPHPSPWVNFARTLLDVSLDIVAVQPSLLGGGRQVQGIIAAVVPNIAAAYDPAKTATQSIAHVLPSIFAEAAIRALAESPHIISSEPRWQRLASAVLMPLQEEVRKSGDVSSLFRAEGRLRELLTGSLSHAALQIVSENADDYLKGSAAGNRAAGAVIRATLGEYLSLDSSSRDIRKVFGADGIQRLLHHTLAVAAEQPGLFIRDNARTTLDDNARKFLSAAATHFQNTGLPRSFDGLFAAELMCVAIDVVSEHMLSRVKARPDSNLQAMLGAEIASLLIGDIAQGFSKAARSGGAISPFERFGKSQLASIVRIIAEYGAKSPEAFLGKGSDPHLVLVAQTIAEAISLDTDGMLSAEDWQSITLACMTAALENPKTLFAKALGKESEGLIAKRLISMMLSKAKENVEAGKDGPGRVLFGRVLSEAIIATLDAASTGVLSVLEDETRLADHLGAVADLVDRLNRLAASRNTEIIIGSREWIRIYTHYIADVLHSGDRALKGLTDAHLLALIRTKPAAADNQEDAG